MILLLISCNRPAAADEGNTKPTTGPPVVIDENTKCDVNTKWERCVLHDWKCVQGIANNRQCEPLCRSYGGCHFFMIIVKTLAMEKIKENIWEFFVTDL